jgi:hypothetical protein
MSSNAARKQVRPAPQAAESELQFAQGVSLDPDRLGPIDQQIILQAVYSPGEPNVPSYSGLVKLVVLAGSSAAAWAGAITLLRLVQSIRF